MPRPSDRRGRNDRRSLEQGHRFRGHRCRQRPQVRYARAELKDVAKDTKDLPDDYINEAANGVTDAFRTYALPLVGALPSIRKLF